MNIKKEISGNIDHAFKNIILNNKNKNSNHKKTFQNRKSPVNKSSLRSNNYYSFNRSPGPTLYDKKNNYYYPENQNQIGNDIYAYESKDLNLEENININNYLDLNKNKNRNIISGRSPINNNYRQFNQNNNYYNQR